jgi:hypothetical protein
MSLSDVLSFSSIEDAKDYFIEKEAENVLRGSHAKQFEWFEKKLGIPLRKDLTIWPTFIEVTERRNLFTHTDGTVSRQYLKVCTDCGVTLQSDIKPGTKLEVPAKYLVRSQRAFFEVGVKLAHVIWRKMCPENREEADRNLNNICYELLKLGRFATAKILLKFACEEIKTYSSQEMKMMMTINYALAFALSDEQKKCVEILNTTDWSAAANKFRLAVAVLRKEYRQAAMIMKTIGQSMEVGQFAYHDWPLFKSFRATDEFLKTYEDVFGEPFAVNEGEQASGTMTLQQEQAA